MGRFWFTCPITGETQVISNQAPGANPRGKYSARLTAEEVDEYEAAQRAQADLFKREWQPAFDRHAHQEHPPEHT